MMHRLQGCPLRAFAEANADLRQQAIFSVKSSRAGRSGTHRSPVPHPHFPLFPPPEPLPYARAQGQKYIQNP